MTDVNSKSKHLSSEPENKELLASEPSLAATDSEQTMTLWQTTQSVLYAMLGVQKSKNAKRDFTKGKASHFIIIGIAFGILFVLIVALCVNIILGAATS